MPPATRRRAQPQPSPPHHFIDPASDSDESDDEGVDDEELIEDVEGEDEEEDEEEPLDPPTTPPSPPLPPGFKEISSLASWTVSSSKPGCSIPQLRNPSTALFWQSDGPQPHLLNIHFFKLVRIVGLRLYLDFEADESYTPTRIQFLAGSGPNDLQEWAELRLEQPRGWVWVGFEGVGEAEGASGPAFAQEDDEDDEDEDDEDDDDEDDDYDDDDDDGGASDSSDEAMVLDGAGGKSLRRQRRRRQRRRRRARMPVLRAFLVQVKILENHQNGKDTHLRGLQIFARDKGRREERPRARMAPEVRKDGGVELEKQKGGARRLTAPEWDRIPDIR